MFSSTDLFTYKAWTRYRRKNKMFQHCTSIYINTSKHIKQKFDWDQNKHSTVILNFHGKLNRIDSIVVFKFFDYLIQHWV